MCEVETGRQKAVDQSVSELCNYGSTEFSYPCYEWAW